MNKCTKCGHEYNMHAGSNVCPECEGRTFIPAKESSAGLKWCSNCNSTPWPDHVENNKCPKCGSDISGVPPYRVEMPK